MPAISPDQLIAAASAVVAVAVAVAAVGVGVGVGKRIDGDGDQSPWQTRLKMKNSVNGGRIERE